MVTTLDIKDLVMRMHDIARELEKDKRYYTFSSDLRNAADRLNRVYENHYKQVSYTDAERQVLRYIEAINLMPAGYMENRHG